MVERVTDETGAPPGFPLLADPSLAGLVVGILLAAAPVLAQPSGVPRTPDGRPDPSSTEVAAGTPPPAYS